MEYLSIPLLGKLTDPGPRLPWISDWLIKDVWSNSFYETLSPTEYLKRGEDTVNRFEVLVASTADRTYRELLAPPAQDKTILNVLSDKETAVVIFDGLSLREIPIMLQLADKSHLKVKEAVYSHAAAPSETLDFVNREFNCGRIGPSQLQGRTELKSRSIAAYYTSNPIQRVVITDDNMAILIWSAFPDNTYTDSGAKFENHFENIHVQFETAWMNSVQQIKGKKRIIITSDHGYAFFGTGMDFIRTSAEIRELNDYFGNNRYAFLSDKPTPPESDDIVIDADKHVAMVKGRIRTKSTGESAAMLYRHGGLSLMEMLTPWIVLEA